MADRAVAKTRDRLLLSGQPIWRMTGTERVKECYALGRSVLQTRLCGDALVSG
jgi:hypothetical protein